VIAVWNARQASQNLDFCIKVVSGPPIISAAGFIYKTHSKRVNLESFTHEIWSACGPERERCGKYLMPKSRSRIIAVLAAKIPDETDSEVQCRIMDLQSGRSLPAFIDGEQVNDDKGWIDLMSVTKTTDSNKSSTAETWILS